MRAQNAMKRQFLESQKAVAERTERRDEQTATLAVFLQRETKNLNRIEAAEETINYVEGALVHGTCKGEQKYVEKTTIPPHFISCENNEEAIEEQEIDEPIKCDYW